MSEPLVHHEMFEYASKQQFKILNVLGSASKNEPRLMPHWHSELEIAYTLCGNSRHYIDGKEIIAKPGKLIVTNSDSIHRIIPHDQNSTDEFVSIVLIISKQFLEENLEGFSSAYFLSEQGDTDLEMELIFQELSGYGNNASPKRTFRNKEAERLYVKSMVLQVISYLVETRMEKKDTIMPINYQKNLERLKGVISYVEHHYKEPISQEAVAKRFYFSPGYFPRYFHRNMQMTFMDYLAKYRVQQARLELLNTSHNVVTVALNQGFSDSRRLINAFKKEYGTTPLQFRKTGQIENNDTIQ